MKKIIVIIILFSCFLFLGRYAFTHDIDAGIGIGYVGPLVYVNGIGDEFFGPGAGQELVDIIGIKSISGTYWITGNIRYHLTKKVLIEGETGYWKKTKRTKPASADYVDVDSIFQDISIGSNIIITSGQSKINPYAGAGIDIHFLSVKINPVQFPEIAERASKRKIGKCVFAGVDIKWKSNIWIFISGRYNMISNWNRWNIYSGIRFKVSGIHNSH